MLTIDQIKDALAGYFKDKPVPLSTIYPCVLEGANKDKILLFESVLEL